MHKKHANSTLCSCFEKRITRKFAQRLSDKDILHEGRVFDFLGPPESPACHDALIGIFAFVPFSAYHALSPCSPFIKKMRSSTNQAVSVFTPMQRLASMGKKRESPLMTVLNEGHVEEPPPGPEIPMRSSLW